MEKNIKKAFSFRSVHSELVANVAKKIVSQELFAGLRKEIAEKNDDLVGEYSFFYLTPSKRSILNVSNIASVFYDLTYKADIKSIDDLKAFLKENEDRLIEKQPYVELSGFGFDVVGFFLSDFSKKLFQLGIIEESQVLDKGYNYATIEIYED